MWHLKPDSEAVQGNKNMMSSKSSMMGVLGVVPEENDSENEEGPLKFTNYSQLRGSAAMKCLKSFRSCLKKYVEKPAFTLVNIIIQSLYILACLIYFYLAFDVDEDNIMAITIILFILTIFINLIYTMILIVKGWRTVIILEYLLTSTVLIMEIVDLAVRAQSNFEKDRSKQGIKVILNLSRVLRLLMIHRRLCDVYNTVMTEVRKQLYNLNDSSSKSPKEILTQLIKRIPQDEDYLMLTLKNVVNQLEDKRYEVRKSRLSQLRKMSSINSGIVNTYQKDIRVDNDKDIDRYIYDVVPDDEDIEKIFIAEEVGDDVRYVNILSQIESLDFNVFELKSVSNGNELVLIINHLMEINEFYTKLNIIKDKFRKYSVIIQKLYNPVSYHNKTHAADVTQTAYYFLTY